MRFVLHRKKHIQQRGLPAIAETASDTICRRQKRGEARRSRRRRRGVSLIELLVVILIIISTATLGIYSMQYMDGTRIRSELNLLHTTCMYLHRKAMATQHAQELTFDATKNSYSFDTTTHQLPACVIFHALPHIMGPPSTPTHALSHPITFQKQRITFYPDGTIQPGTAYFTDNKKRLQYALSCGIAGVAYVRLYHYNGAWKRI